MRTVLYILAGILSAGALCGQAPIGGEFQVNTFTSDDQSWPAVGVDAQGGFVVVWQSLGSVGTDPDQSIQGQVFDAAGDPVGGQFQVNSYTTGTQERPAVAVAADGSFVVVWSSAGSSGSDDSGSSIQGQRFDAAGNLVDGEFQVNAATAGPQTLPDIAVDAQGDFVVVWSDDYASGSESIRGRRFDSAAMPVGAELQIDADLAIPAVASFAGGGFAVVWSDLDSAINGQRFDSFGMPVGGLIPVAAGSVLGSPDIAIEPGGDLFVAWSDSEVLPATVEGRRFDSDGNPLGGSFQLNSQTAGTLNPEVTTDSTGEAVVVWPSEASTGSDNSLTSIQGRRFGSDGAPLGNEFQINTYIQDRQLRPAVASHLDGRFVVVWHSEGSSGTDTSGTSILGQRFDPPAIFADGFESGDVAMWSSFTP